MPTEQELISRTPQPATRASLARQMRENGLTLGSTVLVHSSLSSLGWVAGGPVAVIQALLDCVGPQGTIVMPTHSGDLTDPADWRSPPVPADWVQILRNEMPAYDPQTTPTRNMGAVAELFRTWPGAKRSQHPTCSFAALGKLAGEILADHALESPLGEQSPLSKLYACDASILLLGVGFDVCTMLHLAEERAWPAREKKAEGSPIMENGVRCWKEYAVSPTIDPEHFLLIGHSMVESGLVKSFAVGNAQSMLLSSRTVVDHAVRIWSDGAPPS